MLFTRPFSSHVCFLEMPDLWEDSEVLCLLEVWGDQEIQNQFEGSTRNKKIFEVISARLAERDVVRTADQCREKVKKLRWEYKQIRDHNNVSGRNRKTIRFLPQLDAILGHRPSTQPKSVIESNSIVEQEETEGKHF